jgi:hypothetical protein
VRLLAVLLIAACVGVASASAAGSRSGLTGTVTRGPTSPVCVAEQPCSAPAGHVTLLFWRDGRVVARATTDVSGRYRIRLAPARYRVSRATTTTVGRGLEPVVVRVASGRFTTIDFSIDTGIR